MATQICNVVTINLAALNNATPAGDRTYTATRQLRLYDLKVYLTDDPAAANHTLTVSNGLNLCLSMRVENGAAQTQLRRMGQNAVDTVNDANMVVTAGGTCVFAYDDALGNNVQPFLYAYPL